MIFSINLQNSLKKTKKLLFRNAETGFQNAEIRFQNAETRFENAETPQSRILFARTWMDFAQKKACQGQIVVVDCRMSLYLVQIHEHVR